jgi:hypothetical protein
MSLQMIGNALVASDKVLMIRPRLDAPEKAVEIVLENGELIVLPESEPLEAINAYFSAISGTAPRSTSQSSTGATNST